MSTVEEKVKDEVMAADDDGNDEVFGLIMSAEISG